MVLKCIWTIELNWMEKYGKMEAKHKFWKTNSRDCLGTGNALFSYFDKFSYFDHNLLIYDPISVIQVAG